MADSALRRFLELVTRELGADDARAELGGKDPSLPSIVFANLSDGWRLVAVFDRALPAEERSTAQGKLDRLAQSFAHTLADLHPPVPTPSSELPARRLDDALESLRARTGSVAVVVIDGNSPVLWGSSEGQREIVEIDGIARQAREAHDRQPRRGPVAIVAARPRATNAPFNIAFMTIPLWFGLRTLGSRSMRRASRSTRTRKAWTKGITDRRPSFSTSSRMPRRSS